MVQGGCRWPGYGYYYQQSNVNVFILKFFLQHHFTTSFPYFLSLLIMSALSFCNFLFLVTSWTMMGVHGVQHTHTRIVTHVLAHNCTVRTWRCLFSRADTAEISLICCKWRGHVCKSQSHTTYVLYMYYAETYSGEHVFPGELPMSDHSPLYFSITLILST